MKVNYNVSAMIANNALQRNDNKLSDSLERLSSGLKIANAKDNPSGLAMSRRMNSQIEGLGVAGDTAGSRWKPVRNTRDSSENESACSSGQQWRSYR